MSNETNKRLNCQYCSKRYTAKEGLSRHLQHNHIPCKECGKVCRNHSEYKIHQLVHTSYRPFLCKMCGKGFKCKTSLDHHILCHTDYMPYSCLVCDKKFRQPQGLWRHKKYHQTEKPHVCNVCSKAFCHKADLKRHSKIHEPKTQSHNNRPLSMVLDRYLSDVDQAKTWICTVCQSHFSEFAELEKHICKPVGETSKDIESSAGVSVMKLIGNDAMESETVTQTVVTAQGCQLLLEQHSDVSPPEIENETASAPPSLTVRLTENPNGISEMNDLEHCVSEPGSGLIKFSETFLGSVHFEQEPTLNSRLEDLIVLHKGTSKLATPQVTDNARDSVCLVHKDSPNVVLAKDNVHSELKDQDLLTTNHLIYVIMPSQSDELINGDEVCINQVINASGGDRLMSQDVLASVSESQCLSSPVEGSTAEKLMRVGSCVVSKGQNIQYGQSLLTGKKVPLNKTLEIFPSWISDDTVKLGSNPEYRDCVT
ncbi:hypothetical protein LSH36_110g05085 [Paralvinella palmiformis]|uniref:C2H2-type domain-containing protein n=1 Tax=Paralvinella palmiformis TaxID=53620 RepID=A0AAD9N983_9ANNE|nr:hypothetical protein LSH36_110g05085 [Paralvinella palmiformis]